MILDSAQVLNENFDKIGLNENLSANSIKYKEESLNRTKEAVAKLIKELEEKVETSVTEGKNDIEIKSNSIVDANYIAHLQEEIDILSMDLYNYQGRPAELVESRAIRLVDKMIKAARANSKDIYAQLQKANGVEMTPVSIDVQEISKNSEEPIKEKVEDAIKEEESLNDIDIKETFDSFLGMDHDEIENIINENINKYLAESGSIEQEQDVGEKVEEAVEPEISEIKEDVVTEIPVPRDRFANETEDEYINYLTEFYSNPNKTIDAPEIKEKPKVEVDEYEYVPMTDDEVVASREKITQEEYAKNEKEYSEKVDAVNNKNMTIETEMPVVKDEVQIVPEREIVPEFTMAKEELNDISSNIIEKAEESIEEKPRSVIASVDLREKLKGLTQEELEAQLSELTSETEHLQVEASSVKADKEEGIRINTEIVAEEEEIEKKDAEVAEEEAGIEKERAELEAEEAKAAQELKEKTIERYIALKEKAQALSSAIQSDREELANVNKDTETRRENISNKNRSIETRRENISNIASVNAELKESISKQLSKRDQIAMMISDGEVSEEPIQKVI